MLIYFILKSSYYVAPSRLRAFLHVVLYFHVLRRKITSAQDAPYNRDVLQTAGTSECTFRGHAACLLYLYSRTDWSALGCFGLWIRLCLVGSFFLLFFSCLNLHQALIIWPESRPFLLLWVQIRLKVRSTVRAKSILLSLSTTVWVVREHWFQTRSETSCTFFRLAVFAV